MAKFHWYQTANGAYCLGLIVASGLLVFDDSPRGPQEDKSIETQKPYGWMPPGCQGAFCVHPDPEDTLRVNSELPRQVAAEAPGRENVA